MMIQQNAPWIWYCLFSSFDSRLDDTKLAFRSVVKGHLWFKHFAHFSIWNAPEFNLVTFTMEKLSCFRNRCLLSNSRACPLIMIYLGRLSEIRHNVYNTALQKAQLEFSKAFFFSKTNESVSQKLPLITARLKMGANPPFTHIDQCLSLLLTSTKHRQIK
jgi:hypothetical protein